MAQRFQHFLERLVDEGFVRIRRNEHAPGTNRWSISYVTEGNRKKVADGVIPVLGKDDRDGSLLLGSERRPVIPKSVWKRRLHDATNWGSPILRAFVGPNPFNYPKSPYAVRDALATVVANRPNAVILDFFAGTGTTLQATCMLNAADGGRRQAILVTNNEVGATDAARLAASGHSIGDDEWEARGIFNLVTRPRCYAVITGEKLDGTPVEGEYEDGTPSTRGSPRTLRFSSWFISTWRTSSSTWCSMALPHSCGYRRVDTVRSSKRAWIQHYGGSSMGGPIIMVCCSTQIDGGPSSISCRREPRPLSLSLTPSRHLRE